MQNLNIDTGIIELTINNDPSKVISFNPQDVTFVERFQALYGELKAKLEEYQARAKELDKQTSKDENGIPLNAAEVLIYKRELCEFMREKIDTLFGADTSQKAFGDALNVDMFGQFLTGVTPYITKGRSEKVAQYTTPASAKRNKRK